MFVVLRLIDNYGAMFNKLILCAIFKVKIENLNR